LLQKPMPRAAEPALGPRVAEPARYPRRRPRVPRVGPDVRAQIYTSRGLPARGGCGARARPWPQGFADGGTHAWPARGRLNPRLVRGRLNPPATNSPPHARALGRVIRAQFYTSRGLPDRGGAAIATGRPGGVKLVQRHSDSSLRLFLAIYNLCVHNPTLGSSPAARFFWGAARVLGHARPRTQACGRGLRTSGASSRAVSRASIIRKAPCEPSSASQGASRAMLWVPASGLGFRGNAEDA